MKMEMKFMMMGDTRLRTELDAMVQAFDEHPNHPDVNWEQYNWITGLQERRLYEELSKPHNNPGNPACNVNDLMDEILS